MSTPEQPRGGLTLAATRPDPEFNINTATNTFFKSLGDRVASGQMTLDQARAAQAEMRALQLNPAMANRQAATEIAQRHLQVGPYSPNNMRQLTPAVMPTGEREVIGHRSPVPGVRSGDTRIFADQPTQQNPMISDMRYRGPQPTEHQMLMQQISNRLRNFQPGFKPQGMTTGLGGMLGATRMTPPDMPQRVGAPMPYNPINTTRLEDIRPRGGAGMSMGSILQGLRNMQQQPRSGFVDTMPKMNMPAPTGPQVMAPNAQGMAMGGLMAKYYGGAC